MKQSGGGSNASFSFANARRIPRALPEESGDPGNQRDYFVEDSSQ